MATNFTIHEDFLPEIKEISRKMRDKLQKDGVPSNTVDKILEGFQNSIRYDIPFSEKPVKPGVQYLIIGNESIKISNIRFHFEDFLEVFASAFITLKGITLDTWLLPILSFLIFVKKVKNCATVQIGKNESKVILAIWKIRKEGVNEPTFNNIEKKLNEILREENLPPMERIDMKLALHRLEQLGSIRGIGEDKWQLAEKILLPPKI